MNFLLFANLIFKLNEGPKHVLHNINAQRKKSFTSLEFITQNKTLTPQEIAMESAAVVFYLILSLWIRVNISFMECSVQKTNDYFIFQSGGGSSFTSNHDSRFWLGGFHRDYLGSYDIMIIFMLRKQIQFSTYSRIVPSSIWVYFQFEILDKNYFTYGFTGSEIISNRVPILKMFFRNSENSEHKNLSTKIQFFYVSTLGDVSNGHCN